MKTYYFILFFILLITSCQTADKKPDQIDENNNLNITYNNQKQDVLDIETKISSHDCFFLSYWFGMNEEEIKDVTNYLIQKNEMLSLYDYSKSVDYANNIKFSISTDLKDYNGPITFNGRKLNSISIRLDYYEKPFEELVRFYRTKYGTPISTFIGDGSPQNYLRMDYGYMNIIRHQGYKQYVFIKENTRVILEFQPITAMCYDKFIRITYLDENSYQNKIIELEKASKEHEEIVKQKVKKSFDNI